MRSAMVLTLELEATAVLVRIDSLIGGGQRRPVLTVKVAVFTRRDDSSEVIDPSVSGSAVHALRDAREALAFGDPLQDAANDEGLLRHDLALDVIR
jgi:hypothetical protein